MIRRPEWTRAFDLKEWIMVGLAACALVVAIWLAVHFITAPKRARIAEADAALSQGRTDSAVQAINDIAKLNERGDASDAEVEQAHEAIRKADPASRDRVARYRLCILQQRADCDGVQ